MKYLSLVLFTAALIWTWNVIHGQAQVSQETHSGIQEKLAVLIGDKIKTKLPEAKDIIVERIWTELVNTGKVKAYFIYSFKNTTDAGTIMNKIEGEAILEQKPDDGSGLDHWTLTRMRSTSDALAFEEPLVITPDQQGNSTPNE